MARNTWLPGLYSTSPKEFPSGKSISLKSLNFISFFAVFQRILFGFSLKEWCVRFVNTAFYFWTETIWQKFLPLGNKNLVFSPDFCQVFRHGLSKAPFTCPEEYYEDFCWIFSNFRFGLWAQIFTTLVRKALALFSKPHSICWEDHLWKIRSFFEFFVVPQIFADLWRNCFNFLAENYRQVC